MKIVPMLAGIILLASTTASANPIMTVQEFRGQVVAGPHVRLSYTYNYSSAPTGATTHGTSHSAWVQTGTTSRDTGSGVRSLPILEMCDCHVPSGTTLDYRLVFSAGTSTMAPLQIAIPDTPSSVIGCVAECQAADTQDGGIVDAPLSVDLSPDTMESTPDTGISVLDSALALDSTPFVDVAIHLDVPLSTDSQIAGDAPVATGGITAVDARAATGGTVSAADAAVPRDGNPATGGTTTTSVSSKSSGGGCSLQSPRPSPALPLIALLGLALLGIRRRS